MHTTRNTIIILLLVVSTFGCGTAIDDSTGIRSKKQPTGSAPSSVDADLAEGEAQQVSPKEDPAPKKDAAPKKAPMPGWLDRSTGFRFVLLDDSAIDWETADVETAEVAVYLDLTKDERDEAKQAKSQSEKAFIDFMLIVYPPAAAVASVLTAVAPLLDSLDNGAPRRQSICERKLGKGWHFPSAELVSNAVEDEIHDAFPTLKESRVWLVQGDFWKAVSFDFDGGADGEGSVENEDQGTAERGALCVARDHSIQL